DRKGNTALMQAVSDYDTNKEAIVEILLKNGSDVNAVDKNKRTALMKAIYEPKEPYPGVIEKLIANGAKLDLQDKDGATALTYAVSVRKPDIVKLLLDNNADAKLALSVKAKVKNSDGKYEEKTLKQIIKESEREDVKELKSVLSKYL
ncbi:MAG: ankyrin repeat domain-containing protein, partial [Butyrivibrio sp.]|nr:ankyrin repeat domain-containing protein [Butyrivibrio sp.]